MPRPGRQVATLAFAAVVSAGLLTQAGWYVLQVGRFAADRRTITEADFVHLYEAGRLARRGEASDVYHLEAQLRVHAEVTGESADPGRLLRFNHPPILLPLLALIADDDIRVAYVRWAGAMTSLLAVSAWLMGRMLRQQGYTSLQATLFAGGALLFFPSYVGVLKGQDAALLQFGAAIWIYGLLSPRESVSGAGLALTLIRPQLALMMSLPFLARRRQVWWWFTAGSAVLVACSLVLIGPDGLRDYAGTLTAVASGEAVGLNPAAMFNLPGALLRAAPAMDSAMLRAAGWLLYVLAALTMVVVWWRSHSIDARHAGTAAVVAALASPHLHYHDLALLLIPVCAATIVQGHRSPGWRPALALLPLALSLVLLAADWSAQLRFYVPYLAALGLVLWLWFPFKPAAVPEAE